jgi:hypothetical protein
VEVVSAGLSGVYGTGKNIAEEVRASRMAFFQIVVWDNNRIHETQKGLQKSHRRRPKYERELYSVGSKIR